MDRHDRGLHRRVVEYDLPRARIAVGIDRHIGLAVAGKGIAVNVLSVDGRSGIQLAGVLIGLPDLGAGVHVDITDRHDRGLHRRVVEYDLPRARIAVRIDCHVSLAVAVEDITVDICCVNRCGRIQLTSIVIGLPYLGSRVDVDVTDHHDRGLHRRVIENDFGSARVAVSVDRYISLAVAGEYITVDVLRVDDRGGIQFASVIIRLTDLNSGVYVDVTDGHDGSLHLYVIEHNFACAGVAVSVDRYIGLAVTGKDIAVDVLSVDGRSGIQLAGVLIGLTNFGAGVHVDITNSHNRSVSDG